jgi:hypothetical protein
MTEGWPLFGTTHIELAAAGFICPPHFPSLVADRSYPSKPAANSFRTRPPSNQPHEVGRSDPWPLFRPHRADSFHLRPCISTTVCRTAIDPFRIAHPHRTSAKREHPK